MINDCIKLAAKYVVGNAVKFAAIAIRIRFFNHHRVATIFSAIASSKAIAITPIETTKRVTVVRSVSNDSTDRISSNTSPRPNSSERMTLNVAGTMVHRKCADAEFSARSTSIRDVDIVS